MANIINELNNMGISLHKDVVEKYIESQYTEAMRRQLKGYYGKNR